LRLLFELELIHDVQLRLAGAPQVTVVHTGRGLWPLLEGQRQSPAKS
jgi:hypothetical protein